MSRRMLLPTLAACALLAGCGDPELWARYRAQRAFWHAQREVQRVRVQPRAARPEDYRRSEAAFREIVDGFPPERWAKRGGSRVAADIAQVSGRAALGLARLAELQGRRDEAIETYGRVVDRWASLPELTLEAEVLRAQLREGSGDAAGALAGWERVARGYDPVDSLRVGMRVAVVEAVRRLASAWEASGELLRRDSLLAGEELRLADEAERRRGTRLAGDLLETVAGCRVLRGDLEGARVAWRRALGEPAPDTARARRVIELGEHWLAEGRVDSARGWARWAANDFSGAGRDRALDLLARCDRRAGASDSALVWYDRMIAEFGRNPDLTAHARFERARVYEDLGQWPQARSELSALCAAQPAHPRAMQAWVHVVAHHRAAGEPEMMRIEAGHALAALDLLLATQHDEAVLRRAGEARVAVFLESGRSREAIEALEAVWNRYGVSPTGASLGLQAGRAAADGLRDEALARRLWQIVAERSPDPESRRLAQTALGDLPRTPDGS